jgi:SAM-dependent methyltransferase
MLLARQRLWASKPALRMCYEDYHRRLFAACPSGRILDIGAGSGHAKGVSDDVISLDIVQFQAIDVVADAHRLPFAAGTFAGMTMIDVLHHLESPVDFLNDAARVLKPGGRLAMVEPGITPLSYTVYRLFHDEPVLLGDDPFEHRFGGRRRAPFDANQAYPTLMFARRKGPKRLAHCVPDLQIVHCQWLSLWAFPLTGGFRRWSLLPKALVPALLRLEDSVLPLLGRIAAFRLFVVLQKRGARAQ